MIDEDSWDNEYLRMYFEQILSKFHKFYLNKDLARYKTQNYFSRIFVKLYISVCLISTFKLSKINLKY